MKTGNICDHVCDICRGVDNKHIFPNGTTCLKSYSKVAQKLSLCYIGAPPTTIKDSNLLVAKLLLLPAAAAAHLIWDLSTCGCSSSQGPSCRDVMNSFGFNEGQHKKVMLAAASSSSLPVNPLGDPSSSNFVSKTFLQR